MNTNILLLIVFFASGTTSMSPPNELNPDTGKTAADEWRHKTLNQMMQNRKANHTTVEKLNNKKKVEDTTLKKDNTCN